MVIKLELTEEERAGLLELREFLDEVTTSISQHGFSPSSGFTDSKRFLDALILKIDRAESGGSDG